MAYDDYQGNEYDGSPDWNLPEKRSPWSIDATPPPAAQPVKPPQSGAAPGGILDSLSKAFKAAAPAITAGINKAAGIRELTPAQKQEALLKKQGYKPADYAYSAPDNQAPANPLYKYDAGKNETTYQIPGVKGSATFSGQRKGGGSFSVVPGLSDYEKKQVAAIDARDESRRQMEYLQELSNRLNLATPHDRAGLATAWMQQQARERSLLDANNKFDRRLDFDNKKLNLQELMAKERQSQSKQWLEFQRWQSQQADKRRAFKANKRRGVNADFGAAAPVADNLVAMPEPVQVVDLLGVGEAALRGATLPLAA